MPPYRKIKKPMKRFRKAPAKKVLVAKKAPPITNAGVKKLITGMIFKKAEPKQVDLSFGKTELYHNTFNSFLINQPNTMPGNGGNDSQRIGDQINVSGFYLRLLCGQKATRPNCTWKFFIIQVPKGGSVAYNTVFDNVSGNVLLDNINKDKVKVLKQFTLKKAVPQTNLHVDDVLHYTREMTFPVKIWIPHKKLYKFDINNGTTHNNNDIYLITMVYDAYGTLTTDNIAYQQLVSTMYYKDP